MKRSNLSLLILTTLAASALLVQAPASAQVDTRASRTIPQLHVPSDGSRPNITSANPDDCDEILLVPESEVCSGNAEIAIATGMGETWWKELQLFVNGQMTQSIRAEGNGGKSSTYLTIAPDDLQRAQIVFVKPKFLGIATGVYQTMNLSDLRSKRVTLLWRRDRC